MLLPEKIDQANQNIGGVQEGSRGGEIGDGIDNDHGGFEVFDHLVIRTRCISNPSMVGRVE